MYNIEFEAVSLIFVLIIFVYVCISYPMKTDRNKLFRFMSLVLMITEAVDIFSAFVIDHPLVFSRTCNLTVNTLYYMLCTMLSYLFGVYIDLYIMSSKGQKLLSKFKLGALVLLEISFLINMFFGFFFYISEENQYEHGPFFLVALFCSVLFFLLSGISVIVNIKVLKKGDLSFVSLIIILYLIPFVVQTFFFPKVLLSMFGASLVMLVTFFSLENPDYTKLQIALEELEQTKTQLEKVNKKYFQLAHFDQMSGLMNRTAYEEKVIELRRDFETVCRENKVIILMADINFLKYLNDNLGHPIGDEAIKNTAQIIRETFIDGQSCYRIGGDEFCIISIGTSQIEFEHMYERFQQAVSEKNKKVNYPYSVASAYHLVQNESLDEAMQIVDNMMYENKKEIKKKYPHFVRK